MPKYQIIDELPQLSFGDRQNAIHIDWQPATGSFLELGKEFEYTYASTEDFAILRDDFSFYAVQGATISAASSSFFDPFLLRIYDQWGNVLAVDQDQGDYGTDFIIGWRAPYSGLYYLSASWDQGQAASNKAHALVMNLDQDTQIEEPGFQLLAAPGSALAIGGLGAVFGTSSDEGIAIGNYPTSISFDPSFNKGGDIIFLLGDASRWEIILQGSTAMLASEFTGISLPVGPTGMLLRFSNGAYNLRYDVGSQSVMIGDQKVTDNWQFIEVGPDSADAFVSGTEEPAQVLLQPDATFASDGNAVIFGTSGEDTVYYGGGNITLDPSFNRGGDQFLFGLADAYGFRNADDYEVRVFGSNLEMRSSIGLVAIPVGRSGLVMNYGGNEGVLIVSDGSVMIGDQIVTSDWAPLGLIA